MSSNEYHKPFIKSLLFVAFCTILAMVSIPTILWSWTSLSNKNQTFTTIIPHTYSSDHEHITDKVD